MDMQPAIKAAVAFPQRQISVTSNKTALPFPLRILPLALVWVNLISCEWQWTLSAHSQLRPVQTCKPVFPN